MSNRSKIYIPASEMRKWHPEGLVCSTDIAYARVANELYSLLVKRLDDWMKPFQVKNIVMGLVCWLEDRCSGLHMWDVFLKNYREFFGKKIPFYEETTDEEQSFLDEFRLVLWLCAQTEREMTIVNPENVALDMLATVIVTDWISKGYFQGNMPCNEELAGYLYCEEAQTDIMLVKNVLMWIERRCYLGHWFLKNDPNAADAKESCLTTDQLRYGNNSVAAFSARTWPISMLPQDIYADMIRMEMDDEKDEYAKAIAEIEHKKISLCKIERYDERCLWMKDFHGDEFAVLIDSFGQNTPKTIKKNSLVLSAYAKFRGEWSTIGVSAWYPYDDKMWTQICEEDQTRYELMHADGQYDEFIENHNGRRLFFFKDSNEYCDWLKDELHFIMDNNVGLPYMSTPLAVFFEPNGQITISQFGNLIKSPDNKYYDRAMARDNALVFVVSRDSCSPDCLRYLIDKDYISDANLKSTEGEEHGHQLAQSNLQFLACCMRRDLDWIR